MIYTEKLKEQEFWKRVINNQCNRYDRECGAVNHRKMTEEEVKKYCEK